MSSLTRFVQQVIPFTISSHRIGQVIFVSEVILFSCLITVLICIKNPLLFDPCISISNKLILVFSYIALCVYCFYVISMFYFYCTVMYVDVRLSYPNKDYLLTCRIRRWETYIAMCPQIHCNPSSFNCLFENEGLLKITGSEAICTLEM